MQRSATDSICEHHRDEYIYIYIYIPIGESAMNTYIYIFRSEVEI
ncbi:hypothetical protein LOK49_Contig216G00005 [Camellia lanceoleosa]|nr:hypothetical protein LOK49_Contig216G00005 [Camellia lanceoleosa]